MSYDNLSSLYNTVSILTLDIQLSQLIQWYTYHKATPNKDHPLYQLRFQMNRDSKKLLKCPPQEIQLVLL
jgi:hypothetical protein